MTTATFTQPDSTAQDAAEYKAAIDAATRVMSGLAAQLAVHAAATPNMTVVIDAGTLMSQGALVSIAQQATATITAPVTHPRIDRIVVNQTTGAITRVAGAEAASPTAPAVPAGTLPLARIALATSTTTITNALITDERAVLCLPAINDFAEDTTPDLAADFAWVWDASAGGAKKVKLNKIGITADQVARDQIALTNLRLMLNTAITTGALVQGKQWELSTDEWGSSSTNAAYTASSPNFYANSETYGSDLTGSGTPTSSGGTASNAFDNSTATFCDFGANTAGTISYDFGVAVQPDAVKFIWRDASSSKVGTVKVWSSTDGSAWTLRTTELVAQTDTTTNWLVRIPGNISARYWRWEHTPDSGTYGGAREIEYVTATSTPDMTLIPPASVSVSTAAVYMDVYFLWKDESGTAVLGTDLTVEVSRNGGTNYTAATLTNLGSYDGSYSIIKARADVSGQPSGTSMLCRIKALNSKVQRVAAPVLYAE